MKKLQKPIKSNNTIIQDLNRILELLDNLEIRQLKTLGKIRNGKETKATK